MAKISKSEAGYKHAAGVKQCKSCNMFRRPHSCTLVVGVIRPDDTCRYFERGKAGLTERKGA